MVTPESVIENLSLLNASVNKQIKEEIDRLNIPNLYISEGDQNTDPNTIYNLKNTNYWVEIIVDYKYHKAGTAEISIPFLAYLICVFDEVHERRVVYQAPLPSDPRHIGVVLGSRLLLWNEVS